MNMLYLSTNAKKPYNETRNYKPILFFQTKAAITNPAFSLTLSLPTQCDLVKVKNMFILEKLMKNLKKKQKTRIFVCVLSKLAVLV